jgi:GH15 family glucan-1,4-alpha-glucosidase
MALRIEDYALIGDCETAALVGRDGSIDWLCLPRFDSGACFAALLGGPEHGRWLLAPAEAVKRVERSYRDATLVLDTTFHTEGGAVRVTDCMPIRERAPRLVRIVRGVHGRVRMSTELIVRFDYGSVVPWVRKGNAGLVAIAGPDSLRIQSDVELRGENLTTVGAFDVVEGQTISFALSWHPSYVKEVRPFDPVAVVDGAERGWRRWSEHCTYDGEWRAAVLRSLITLKALTHNATGGIIAAPTTSLPEAIGGVRNWDYRYAWIRDATFTLLAFVQSGFFEEAQAWREWLLRAVAGDPSKLQILYGVDGERRIEEGDIPWLPGYEGSLPVRVGNAAFEQRQLDVYGEIMDALFQCRRHHVESNPTDLGLSRALLEFLETTWNQPDYGIWEVRGPQRQFTHSKVMAWVAFDRAVRGLDGLASEDHLERWRKLRGSIHDEVCRSGFDNELGSFVQYYGSKRLDASLLMIPLVGFLPASDARMRGTVRAVEERLLDRGLVRRYENDPAIDGLPAGEGAFLPCSFWLADNLALLGRLGEARRLFERLVDLRNDLGLLSEEYDAVTGRLVGNFPQAFSHVALVNSAHILSVAESKPTRHPRDPVAT